MQKANQVAKKLILSLLRLRTNQRTRISNGLFHSMMALPKVQDQVKKVLRYSAGWIRLSGLRG